MDLSKIIKDNLDTIKDIRYNLHNNAELSLNEFKTQQIVLNFLHDLNINTEIFAQTGAIGKLNEGDHCIAIRADMDALPVNGASHLCGHDYHMAIVLGCALILKKIGFNKCIKFIFQPAEESEGGAIKMIEQGVLENPEVKSIIGFHVWPMLDVGKIEIASGASMASVDDFCIKFTGLGGHAAMPELCKNPIYPAVDFIETMTMKSRIEQNPLNSHIITFSSIQCGSAPNVISNESKVLGTARTFDNELRYKINKDIVKVSSLCAEKYDCKVDIEYSFQYPPLISDTELTNKFIDMSQKLLGCENILPLEKTFAAEDFSYFAEKVPAIHFRLGISDGIKGTHPLHSSLFDASDDALFYAIYVITNFLLSF